MAHLDDDDIASSNLFEIEWFSAGGVAQSLCPVVFRHTGDAIRSSNWFFYGGGRRRSVDEGLTAGYELNEASSE